MCITHSSADEEKRSTEIDNDNADNQSDAMMVRNVLFLYPIPTGLERIK
jgi:hypothetical protein